MVSSIGKYLPWLWQTKVECFNILKQKQNKKNKNKISPPPPPTTTTKPMQTDKVKSKYSIGNMYVCKQLFASFNEYAFVPLE